MNDEGWAAGAQRSIHLHSLASLQGQDGNSAALTVQPWREKGSALSCGLGHSGSAEPWAAQDQEQSGPSVSLDVFFHHLGIFQLGFRERCCFPKPFFRVCVQQGAADGGFVAKIIPGHGWLWLSEPPGTEPPSARASQGDTSSPHTHARLCSSWAATEGWEMVPEGEKLLWRGPHHLGSCQEDKGSPKDAPAAAGPTWPRMVDPALEEL
ncbi:uncharacterized protein LOC125336452 isoform X1 [Corvus hawaiiensis]|uniref:uncharacterized protein LOC125336452 isoform X1 n=1 Tax=Corvus hawaiiensis TaxID=134902 RepID=UPI00201908C2|nr:uncharacterized protein LOC125336452 isoform X1 [Corvus hawaiiensis]